MYMYVHTQCPSPRVHEVPGAARAVAQLPTDPDRSRNIIVTTAKLLLLLVVLC